MNIIRDQKPSELLSNCILKYCYKQLSVPVDVIVPASTDQFLEFYMQGRYSVIDRQNNSEFLSPASIFIGQQTTRNWDLRLNGQYRMFFIHFTPNGFFRLFNTPMKEFTNQAIDPEGLISKEIRLLHEQLSNATEFEDMVSIAENFLARKLISRPQPVDRFDEIINHITRHHGLVDINWLIDQSNLSTRQFERRFDQQLGISPKTFIRKTRLNRIIQLKKQQPHLTWTDLTYCAGYFDQAHMIKDFRALTGDSPKAFFKQISTAPNEKAY